MLGVLLVGRVADIVVRASPWSRHEVTGDATRAAPLMVFSDARAEDVRKVLAANLFGSAADTSVDRIPAAATQAQLLLLGVIAMPDPSSGWAIMGSSAADARLLRAGQPFSSEVRLLAVLPDRVLIERTGLTEYLMLPKVSSAAFGVPEFLPLSSEWTGIAGTLGQILGPRPVVVGGSQRGYRLQAQGGTLALSTQGLRAGDLLTAVNGELLTDPSRSRQLLSDLSAQSQVVVTVQRGGQAKTLSINLLQIAADLEHQQQPLPTEGVASPAFRPYKRRPVP